jgi:hypothetical protein
METSILFQMHFNSVLKELFSSPSESIYLYIVAFLPVLNKCEYTEEHMAKATKKVIVFFILFYFNFLLS